MDDSLSLRPDVEAEIKARPNETDALASAWLDKIRQRTHRRRPFQMRLNNDETLLVVDCTITSNCWCLWSRIEIR